MDFYYSFCSVYSPLSHKNRLFCRSYFRDSVLVRTTQVLYFPFRSRRSQMHSTRVYLSVFFVPVYNFLFRYIRYIEIENELTLSFDNVLKLVCSVYWVHYIRLIKFLLCHYSTERTTVQFVQLVTLKWSLKPLSYSLHWNYFRENHFTSYPLLIIFHNLSLSSFYKNLFPSFMKHTHGQKRHFPSPPLTSSFFPPFRFCPNKLKRNFYIFRRTTKYEYLFHVISFYVNITISLRSLKNVEETQLLVLTCTIRTTLHSEPTIVPVEWVSLLFL